MEIWKDIKGYEGLYQVSNEGRVKSLEKSWVSGRGVVRHQEEKMMKVKKDKGGYLKVGLSKNGKQKVCSVHKLVAIAFIPNPENKPCIDHINGKRDDDRVENLRWCTQPENNGFPLARENKSKALKGRIFTESHREHLSDAMKGNTKWLGKHHSEETKKKISETRDKKTILQFTLDGEFVKEWKSTLECEKNGFYHSHISACCKGKIKTHKGYIWKYKNDQPN